MDLISYKKAQEAKEVSDNLEGLMIDDEYFVTRWKIAGVGSGDGQEYPNPTRVISDFIKVREGMIVEVVSDNTKGAYISFYDKDKKFIKYRTYAEHHEIDENGYIRVMSGHSNDIVIDDIKYFLNKFKVKLNTEEIPEGELLIGEQYINNWEVGTIDSEGVSRGRSDRIRTSFIKAPKNTSIYAHNLTDLKGIYLVQYDEDKNHLKQYNYADNHVTKTNGYIRLVVAYDDDRDIKDTTFIINNVIARVLQDNIVSNYLFGDFSSYYESYPEESVTNSDEFNLESSTIEDIYSEYDSLLYAYPHIMEKNLLGYGGNANNVEDDSLPIYEYTINALSGVNSFHVKAPTILIMTGTHGDEKSTVWSAVKFINQMFNNWHSKDNLESILSNVNLRIIPVMNPGGYNDNTRVNRHGVDINRNFSYRWEEFDMANYNKGDSPYSELETQIARDWMIENKNSLAFIDYHNVFSRYTISYLDTPNKELHKIYSSQIRRMSNHWYRKYGDIEEATLGQVQGYITVDEAPMTFQEGIIQGVKYSTILETARDYNGVQFNSVVIERGVEVLSNFILGLLDAYSKNLIE